ncbi:MAG: hypothetical protein AABY27_04020 [Pseudomonadota bacterium]
MVKPVYKIRDFLLLSKQNKIKVEKKKTFSIKKHYNNNHEVEDMDIEMDFFSPDPADLMGEFISAIGDHWYYHTVQ